MGRTTQDRGEIVHWAGHHQRSPALKAGLPVFVGHGSQPAAVRCGWEPFFDAARERGLVFNLEQEADAASFISAGETATSREKPPAFGPQLAEAARFGRAFIALAKRARRGMGLR